MKPYNQTVEELEKKFNTNIITGLTDQEVQSRVNKFGCNKIEQECPEPFYIIFLNQFANPLIYILLTAAAIIFFMGERLDAFIISGVLTFNAIVGTFQEGRTRKILESLKNFVPETSTVIRNSEKIIINTSELVPGDIVILKEGEQIPADGRIVEVYRLIVDQSILTGESIGVEKKSVASQTLQEQSILDQDNMAFKGTYILNGNAKMLVTATGKNCEIGKIQQISESIETDMPLKRELDKLSHWVLISIIVICFGLLIIGLLQGKTFSDLLVMLTALFICVVPEGLPVVFTVILVSGAYKMAKENVLVKRLQAVEALGRTEIIVVDKTGTLTRNEMMVHAVFADNKNYVVTGYGYSENGDILFDDKKVTDYSTHKKLYEIKDYLDLMNSSEIWQDPKTKNYHVKGDPIEVSIGVFAKKIADKNNLNNYKKVFDIPFNTQTRLHISVFQLPDLSYKIFALGAPEAILNIVNNKNNSKELIQANLENYLQSGLRVVACAQVSTPGVDLNWDKIIRESFGNFEFDALIGLQDAIREDVASVISKANKAGVDFVMITGDHQETARFVAQSVGILKPGQEVITGEQFEKFSDQEFFKKINNIKVFARVTPAQKLKIIELLKCSGKTVAMIGDGVNDAPPLVAADLGIAMGQIGTEVAKQASDLILLDDKLSTVLSAIEQGRHIFYTLRRVVLYFFATNFGEVLVVLLAFLLKLDVPILAAQILWLNLVTDGFLDLALAAEPVEPGLLEKSWLRESLKKGLIDPMLMLKVAYMSIPMAVGSIYLFDQYCCVDMAAARTMTLVCMAMFQWFNAWNCRSENLSLFQIGLFSNFWLVLATGFVLILQVLVTTVPFLQYIFKTVPLSLFAWVQILCVSSSILIFEEIRKLIVRKVYNNF